MLGGCTDIHWSFEDSSLVSFAKCSGILSILNFLHIMRCISSPLVDCPATCSGRLPHPFSPNQFNAIYQPKRPQHILRGGNASVSAWQSVRCEASGNGAGNGTQHVMSEEIAPKSEAPLIWTKFVAETLLPTGQGKFRLRGYRHTVRFTNSDCFSKRLDLSFLA